MNVRGRNGLGVQRLVSEFKATTFTSYASLDFVVDLNNFPQVKQEKCKANIRRVTVNGEMGSLWAVKADWGDEDKHIVSDLAILSVGIENCKCSKVKCVEFCLLEVEVEAFSLPSSFSCPSSDVALVKPNSSAMYS